MLILGYFQFREDVGKWEERLTGVGRPAGVSIFFSLDFDLFNLGTETRKQER